MQYVDIDAVREYNEFIGLLESQHIRSLLDIAKDMPAYYSGGAELCGQALPFPLMKDKFRCRPGELTLWAGFSGHGKSMMIGQALLGFVRQGATVGVASFEMNPTAILDRHLRQILGRAPSDRDNYREIWDALEETSGKYYVYDERHLVTTEKVIGVASHFAGKLGVQHIVIDSIVKCGIKRNPDFAGNIVAFINQLQSLAKHYQTHVHLVSHLRKGEGENRRPTKHDIKYAGEIADLAENVLLVWRNRAKEDGEATIIEHDAVIEVAKQRYLTWEGRVNLGFDPDFQSWFEINPAL